MIIDFALCVSNVVALSLSGEGDGGAEMTNFAG
jgi:hypothetical protein